MNYLTECPVPCTAQKMKFSIKDIFSKCEISSVNLFRFTEEILNGKLHFLCSVVTDHIFDF